MKRTLIHISGKAYYAIRDHLGRFMNIENIGRSIRRDSATKAKTKVKPGQGFRGDLKR